jgi:peptidoglycan/LPS O-acetylase OafA/YrhL
MLQDLGRYPGVFVRTFFNSPLWSISYEWFFYLLYLPLLKIKPNYSIFIKGLILSLFGILTFYFVNNKISMTVLYFIIWIIGADIAESYLENSKYIFKKFLKHVIILSIFVVLFLSQVDYEEKMSFGFYPFIQSYHFLTSLIFIVVLFFLQNSKYLANIKQNKTVTFFSNISYSLYAIHYPICISFSQIFFNVETVSVTAFIIGLIITIVISYLLEVKIQKFINKRTNKYLND